MEGVGWDSPGGEPLALDVGTIGAVATCGDAGMIVRDCVTVGVAEGPATATQEMINIMLTERIHQRFFMGVKVFQGPSVSKDGFRKGKFYFNVNTSWTQRRSGRTE